MTTVPEPEVVLETAPVGDSRWRALVERDAAASAFHHPAWSRLVERCYGYEGFVLAEIAGDGTISAGLPVVEVSGPLQRRRWVSVPFADHCAPLGRFAGPGELGDLLATARRRAGVAVLEIRASLEGPSVQHGSGWVRHVLALGGDVEAQFASFHRMTRRNVRQAERSGLTVRAGEDETALTETFYALHVATRRRLGVPVQPRRFFRLLWEELLEPGLGYVLVVWAGAKPVAAAVFLRWNGNLIYKFGASDPAEWQRRPNNLLFWHAIREAIGAGDLCLDLGRTEVSQTGLRSFKAGWGAREEPLAYSYLSEGPPASGKHGPPAFVAPVIRRSPVWVSRVLGELFYRYAA